MENRNLSRFWKGLSVWDGVWVGSLVGPCLSFGARSHAYASALWRRRPVSLVFDVSAIALLLAYSFQAQSCLPLNPESDHDEFECVGVSVQYSGSSENTQSCVESPPGPTTLVREQAEQDTYPVAQNVEAKLWPAFGSYNETYECVCAFEGDDSDSNSVFNVIVNIGQLLRYWFFQWFSSLRNAYSQLFLYLQSDPNFVSQWNSGKTLVMED